MVLAGFGNIHQTEAKPGALPSHQNSPQRSPYGLYAEQISGTAFTRPRHQNLHTWTYRCLPSVVHKDYKPYRRAPSLQFMPYLAPNPYRWFPFPLPKEALDFVDGLIPIAGSEKVTASLYQCGLSMSNKYFVNQDAELLFVPYEGKISLVTELGELVIGPGQIAVVPRGIVFKVKITSLALGY